MIRLDSPLSPLPAVLLALSLVTAAGPAMAQQTFTFAGHTFNQLHTPDVATALTAGTYSGAVVTAIASGTGSVNFPANPVPAAFDSSKSLGRLLVGGSGARIINLPLGDNGSTARSGFELSWSGGRTLGNATGHDFVVYESASDPTGVEAFLVQVRVAETATWSAWRHEQATVFQPYNPLSPTGAGGTATPFDLSDFGVTAAQHIDRIRLVNVTDEDRTVDASGVGQVIPEDSGTTSSFLPVPGPLRPAATSYASTAIDPDPLYVGVLHCGDGDVDAEASEQCDPGTDVAGDCCTAGCVFEADSTACDDGLFCTATDACTAGACTGSGDPCDDGEACTADACDEGSDSCSHDGAPLDGSACDDGAYCTVGDQCAAGACSGTPRDCSDDAECTADSCDEGADACEHDGAPLDGTACGAGAFCTAPGLCAGGACSGTPTDCDDANPCTADGCDEAADACTHDDLDGVPCDDGLFCTATDACADGACTGSGDACDDGEACTADACDEGNDSCSHDGAPMDGSACDDGLYCSVNDQCAGGACSGAARDCDDAVACTADSCDEGADACAHDGAPLDGTACVDADACTAGSTCSAGACGGGVVVEACGDAQVCGGEQCDDANAAELDGCSSDCEVEDAQDEAQQDCIVSLNAAAAKLARSQGQEARACVKSAAAGDEPDAQACLTADGKGKVAKRRTAIDDAASACTSAPGLGETDPAVVGDAAVEASVALVADLFGADLGAAVLDKDTAAEGAKCQGAVLKAAMKLAAVEHVTFVRCKKDGLAAASIVSRATLRQCLDEAADDAKGKAATAKDAIAAAVDTRCAGIDAAAALPGACAAAADRAACVVDAVECRVCASLDGIDALGADCCP